MIKSDIKGKFIRTGSCLYREVSAGRWRWLEIPNQIRCNDWKSSEPKENGDQYLVELKVGRMPKALPPQSELDKLPTAKLFFFTSNVLTSRQICGDAKQNTNSNNHAKKNGRLVYKSDRQRAIYIFPERDTGAGSSGQTQLTGFLSSTKWIWQ